MGGFLRKNRELRAVFGPILVTAGARQAYFPRGGHTAVSLQTVPFAYVDMEGWNHMFKPARLALAALLVALVPLVAAAQTAKPSVIEALKLKPIQANAEYDVPEGPAAEKCTLAPIKSPQLAGWEVRDGDGNVLRRFLDTNADNKVDQWCYFKDGVEVYRDIDRNFNRKADECRWLGTSGIRWALDTNEDGRIDQWKAISPEEVSEEVMPRSPRRRQPVSPPTVDRGRTDEPAVG